MADRSYLGWPFLDDAHRTLAGELDAWAAAEVGGLEEPDEVALDEHCRGLVRSLAGGGWLEPVVGAPIDVRALCLARETLARHHGLADFAFAMQGLGSGAISLFGSEAQQQSYLPAVARGEKIAAFALTEPGSGSDVAAIETAAVESGDGYRIDGAKTYISNGGIADFYVLFARTGEAPGSKGISAFIADAGTEGLDDGERIQVIAPHPLATLKFSNMRLPASA